MGLGTRFCFTLAISFGIAMTARAAHAACLVRGSQVSLEHVTVQPRGSNPFTLDIQGAPAVVEISPRSAGLVAIDVQGALRFSAQRKNLWLTLGQDFASADGLVAMHRGAQLVHARVDGNAVIASAVEYADDVLPGEDKDAEEVVTPVRLPCSLLTLDAPDFEALAAAKETDESASASADTIWWEPKAETKRVRVYAQPRVGPQFIDLVDQSCTSCIDFVELGEHGDWLEVQRSGEGVLMRGWGPRSAVKQVPPELSHGRSGGCSGDHAGGLGGEHGSVVPLYDGPATIVANTRIYAEPGRGEWATVAENISVQIRYYAGSNWAQLSSVPGIGSGVSGIKWLNAYVPLSRAVISPSKGKP